MESLSYDYKQIDFKNLMKERILIDRKRKMYQSWINTFQYVEECNYSEFDGGVRYVQKYSVPFFLKSKKEKVFKCGCEVIEKIISSNNLRDRL